MPAGKTYSLFFILLGIGLALLFVISLCYGPVTIPFTQVLSILTGGETSKPAWNYIVMDYRLPKALTALLTGMGLSISGLMMQTLFRNPLAGPYVLGLSSGSGLGVAFAVMGAGFLPAAVATYFTSPGGIILASCAGSLLVLLAVIAVSGKMRETMSILVVGLMFGSFTGAIIGVLTYFAPAEQLQKFTFWSLGNLGNLSWNSVAILCVAVVAGMAMSIKSIKPLDALLLGENYARSLGINIVQSRWIIIAATSVLAGSITAFAGPVAFIGLAVPHMARLVFRSSSHRIIFPATLMIGGIVMLFCDIATQVPGTEVILPINAITSIIGAPVVIWLLLKKPFS